MGKRAPRAVESLLHLDRMPSVWCPGCGIGIVVNTLVQTVDKLNIPREEFRLVSSGISCAGKIPEYLRLPLERADSGDVFRTALDLKRERPGFRVVAVATDNDLIVSGVDGLAELLSSGEDVLILYLNSCVLNVLVEHRRRPELPLPRRGPAPESGGPFNIPRLADVSGAAFVARWTPLHCRRIAFSLKRSLRKTGPALIEVIVPCLMYFASRQGTGTVLDRMGHYLERAVLRNREPTECLDMREDSQIVIGTFIDR